MATRHTGGDAQDGSDTDTGRSEQGDRTEKGSEKGKRSVTQKILHSKAVQRMTGRRLGADVTPAKKLQPLPQTIQRRMVEVSHVASYCASMTIHFRRVGDKTTSSCLYYVDVVVVMHMYYYWCR